MKGLSLRYKLLAALTIIPMVGLSLFLVLAINIFEQDKIAYVFDSSLSVSKNRAARVSSDISAAISLTQAIVLSYRADTKNLAESGTYYFDRESKIQGFRLYTPNPASGVYEKNVDLAKDSVKELINGSEQSYAEIVQATREKPIVVGVPKAGRGQIIFAARFGELSDPRHVVAVGMIDETSLFEVFDERGTYTSFLQRKDGLSIFGAERTAKIGWTPDGVWQELKPKGTPEGIAELKTPAGERYLAAFTDVGTGDLVVVSMVSRHAALQAVDTLLRKSILFFIIVLSLTAIIAVLASRGLTSTLSRLSIATQKIAMGNFGVRVEMNAGGELGVLARSFNAMAQEVSRLMVATAEKARMESELATAKAVQETLFPESTAEIGPVQISGYYMPASECGGDWWYYCENGGNVYIWIGDATGHGAPAALLTSAARAVASVIGFGPARSASDSLQILNRAICETSKGKMMMTFFLACINKETGVMTYANASHEPPLLLHQSDTKPERGDFIPLNEVNNPRLGEQIDCKFAEATLQLQAGDRIIFYTDGVTDVKNTEYKGWGERRFLKSLSIGLSENADAEPALANVVHQLETFRANTPLDDDVTLVVCNFGDFKGAA